MISGASTHSAVSKAGKLTGLTVTGTVRLSSIALADQAAVPLKRSMCTVSLSLSNSRAVPVFAFAGVTCGTRAASSSVRGTVTVGTASAVAGT